MGCVCGYMQKIELRQCWRHGDETARVNYEIKRSSQLRTLLKKIQARTGFERMTSATPMQRCIMGSNPVRA